MEFIRIQKLELFHANTSTIRITRLLLDNVFWFSHFSFINFTLFDTKYNFRVQITCNCIREWTARIKNSINRNFFNFHSINQIDLSRSLLEQSSSAISSNSKLVPHYVNSLEYSNAEIDLNARMNRSKAFNFFQKELEVIFFWKSNLETKFFSKLNEKEFVEFVKTKSSFPHVLTFFKDHIFFAFNVKSRHRKVHKNKIRVEFDFLASNFISSLSN